MHPDGAKIHLEVNKFFIDGKRANEIGPRERKNSRCYIH